MKHHLADVHGVDDADTTSVWASWVYTSTDFPTSQPEKAARPEAPPPSPTLQGYPVPEPFTVVAAVYGARRRALIGFAIGVGVFSLGAVNAIVASKSDTGAVIWTGGMIVGALLSWRSLQVYRAARPVGLPTTWGGRALVAVGAAACLALGVAALNATGPSSVQPSTDVGSCWKDAGGGQLSPVSCQSAHDYRVTSVVSDPTSCPYASESYVELSPSEVDCLVND